MGDVRVEGRRENFRWIARLLKIAILQSICVLVTSACSPVDGGGHIGVEDATREDVVSSISYVKGLYNGYSYYIATDIIIEGVVTANNAFGEFPSGIVIEDSSGAIEVLCGIDCVTYGFVVGATVRVVCSGLYIGSVGGMLSIGGAPHEQTPTTPLSREEVTSHVRICDDEIVERIPALRRIAELQPSDILRYVEIRGVHFVMTDDSSPTFCSRDEESGMTQHTTHVIEDEQGEQISISVHREVEYADELIPLGTIDIAAIVEYFNGEYSLRIVNRKY